MAELGEGQRGGAVKEVFDRRSHYGVKEKPGAREILRNPQAKTPRSNSGEGS